ncbi:MAG: hypothetical protein KF757_07885 [Phycisphaeraceae bacterium]|nr:hypothetical protein [Phycisphaeraceae bacterium]MCW5762674.1 hypothetical protein [Phycisphaeraceae bacterium]
MQRFLFELSPLFIGTMCASSLFMACGHVSGQVTLRIVGEERCETATVLPPDNAGVSLAPTDPRWVFAVRVAASLEGGRAGVLTPAKRDHLLRLADLFGLRPFDASLIIAIVQDSVRCGRKALGVTTAERLSLVRPVHAGRADSRSVWMTRIGLCLMLGAVGAFMLARLVQ